MGGKYIRDYEHFKRAFSFYLYTGARMSEPFLGEIRGRWLVISPNESKSHKKRIIKLTEEQVIIVEEMRERVGNSEDKENAIRSYSKAFKKVVRAIGLRDDLHLHSLRHTYGCMRRLVTNGNMVQIRDEMGHTKLSTTERYTQIPLDMLEDDFPELSKNLQNNQLGPQTRTPHMFENKKDSR
jgi:Phage integrase family.